MSTQFKSKSEVKAEQNASQDAKSQDNSQNLNIADGVTKFYETRCEFYEKVFMQADQQAAKDVMGKFLSYDKDSRESVGGNFFGNLATKRQALNFGLLPSLFLPEVVSNDQQSMLDRNHELIEAEKVRPLTQQESDELDELQNKLTELGLID